MLHLVAQQQGSLSPLVLAVLLGLAALLPSVLLVGTSFVKISVVLGLLRNALGAEGVPGGAVVAGLAVVLSVHVMAPTATSVSRNAGPAIAEALSADIATIEGRERWSRAWTAARAPVIRFLGANALPRDRAVFYDLARRSAARQGGEAPGRDDLSVLLPAFAVSELGRAFVMGFAVFLPFLVVDVVVANVLAAMGLAAMSPSRVALPFKLLLFVAADGWQLIARALVLGYR